MLLFQFRIEIDGDSGKRRQCEERIILFKARSARQALAKAKRRGKAANSSYKNDEGNIVYFEFVGIIELLHLGIECDADEVWYKLRERLLPMERRRELLPQDSELNAIQGRIRCQEELIEMRTHDYDERRRLIGEFAPATGTRYGYVGKEGYETFESGDASPHYWGEWVGEPVPFGFIHTGHRWYDPGTGRFLQRDPLGIRAGMNGGSRDLGSFVVQNSHHIPGGIGVYDYVHASPVFSIDALGLTTKTMAELEAMIQIELVNKTGVMVTFAGTTHTVTQTMVRNGKVIFKLLNDVSREFAATSRVQITRLSCGYAVDPLPKSGGIPAGPACLLAVLVMRFVSVRQRRRNERASMHVRTDGNSPCNRGVRRPIHLSADVR